jgi:hypothetical protein
MATISTFIRQLRAAADALELLVEAAPTKRGIGTRATALAILNDGKQPPAKPKALHWTKRPENRQILAKMARKAAATRIRNEEARRAH